MPRFLTPFLLLLITLPAWAFEPFVVQDIRIEGLQRISAGAVLNQLPVRIGDRMDENRSARVIHSLYKSGFFKDVRLERDGNTLVVFVAERPSIAEIVISGNDAIPTEQMNEALKQIGLSQGKVLNRALLDKIRLELERQYYSLGKYGVQIKTTTTPLERNRVKVSIEIAEGEEASVYAINIVGNKAFSDAELLSRLQLSKRSFFTGGAQYSRQLLAGDLETLKSWYLDRGYIHFNIESTQVSLTPDRQDVYITINVTEGEQYRIRDVKLAGELILPKDVVMSLVTLEAGGLFSRKEAVDSTKRISDRLAEIGYAFANVNIIPDVDEKERTVGVTLFVDPGQKVYVRRINISGNTKTKDEVIRRELRQMEGDWMSTKKIALSRTRLNRTGYFETVGVETPSVPGTPDLVDVNFSVAERPTGNLSAGLGYSDTQGALFNFSISQENFLGTGKRVSINVDNSQVTKNYSFNYNNPYHTLDGINRGFSIYYRAIDAAQAQIANYSTDSYGANITYGFPLSEVDSSRFTVGYENSSIVLGNSLVSQDVLDFVAENGDNYGYFPAIYSWTRDSRNRRILATRGGTTSFVTEVAIPGGELEYYKVNLRHLQYFPVSKRITLLAKLNLGYGDAFGETTRLPPWKKYYAGGSRTVRGYEANSLGPVDPVTGQRIGGDRKLIGNLELILPNPFAEREGSTRLTAFVDIGNVYAKTTPITADSLRFSTGIGLLWLSPVGALRFSYAIPFNTQEGDKLQAFQFTMGSAF